MRAEGGIFYGKCQFKLCLHTLCILLDEISSRDYRRREELMMSVESIIAEIEKLNVLELVELTKALQGMWSVNAATEAHSVVPTAAPVVARPDEEQTEFDVILTEVGVERIKVITVVRELTGLGMKEARDLVDAAPSRIKEAISKEEADMIVGRLEVGATG